MRKLMWFALGFSASCGACAYGLDGRVWGILLLAAFGVLIVTAAAGRSKILRCAVVLCLGCVSGLIWFSCFRDAYLEPAAKLDGTEEMVSVTVRDYSYETNYGVAADAVLVYGDRTYQTRIYLNGDAALSPGDTVSGTFRFRLTAPGGQEEATYHSGKGIFLLAYQRGEITVDTAVGPEARFFAARLAGRIKAILRTCFPEDVFPFVQALLLGDAYDLDYETDVAFQVTGVRHVVAVSGLHVSILFGMLSLVTFKKRFLTALAGFPLLLVFAAVAGFSPSVTRACIMAALMLLALLLNKEYDGPTALAFAVLVMELVNPLVITAVGFQLSVLSVSGIYLFNPSLNGWLSSKLGKEKGRTWKARLKGWFASSVSITLSAILLTTPLSAYYFGTVSLIGPVTNLLVLWVIWFVFYGSVAVCLLSLVWLPGASFLAALTAVPVRYILGVTKLLGKFPLAAVYTQSRYVVWWLVFVYILLAFFLVQKNRKPVVLFCCAVIGLCIALLASWQEPVMDESRITVLDVGQGQSILLQSEGKTYLIDCGGDNDEMTADLVARTLLSQGVFRLDGMVLTHLDRDHTGGAKYLLSRIDTDLLLMPCNAEPKVAAEIASKASGKVVYVSQDLLLSYGDTKMHLFPPYYSGSDNENSLCILFDTEKCDILITGDRSSFGERLLLRRNVIGDVDVLIAGHHGAEDSTCEELLLAVRPEIVCISVSQDNPYGHPGAQLLARLEQYGCAVYRTDRDGTILIRR